MTPLPRTCLSPLFRLFTVVWWALALNWATDGVLAQAAYTFCFGLIAFVYAEHLNRKETLA